MELQPPSAYVCSTTGPYLFSSGRGFGREAGSYRIDADRRGKVHTNPKQSYYFAGDGSSKVYAGRALIRYSHR